MALCINHPPNHGTLSQTYAPGNAVDKAGGSFPHPPIITGCGKPVSSQERVEGLRVWN
jgi:hypothetical protein